LAFHTPFDVNKSGPFDYLLRNKRWTKRWSFRPFDFFQNISKIQQKVMKIWHFQYLLAASKGDVSCSVLIVFPKTFKNMTNYLNRWSIYL